MKILLLGTRGVTEDSEAYYAQYINFFKKAAQQSHDDLDIVYAFVDDLFITIGDGVFTIHDTRNGWDLSEYAAVLVRGHIRQHLDVVKTVSIYLSIHDIPSINDYSAARTGSTASKLIQAVQLYTYGAPVAQTVFVTSGVINHLDRLPFGFPCIMKATNGSHGHFNYKLSQPEDVLRILDEDKGEHTFVLQRFMPNDSDYRVLIAGNGTLVIKRSALGDSHLNNTSQGGDAILVDTSELPAEILEQCHGVARHIGLTIAGVDVLYDKSTQTYSFLEVNSQPQLMTGAFVEEKAELVGRLLQDLSRTPR